MLQIQIQETFRTTAELVVGMAFETLLPRWTRGMGTVLFDGRDSDVPCTRPLLAVVDRRSLLICTDRGAVEASDRILPTYPTYVRSRIPISDLAHSTLLCPYILRMSCKDSANLKGGRVCTGRVDQASLSKSESNVSTRLLVRSTYMVSEKRLGGIRDIFDTEARKPPIREDTLFQAERHVSNPPQLLT